MNTLRTILVGGLCAAVLAPAASADGRNPGSVLIYPVHKSGPDLFTVVCTTNTSTIPQTPTDFGGSTAVHYEYVNVVPNPANVFRPLDCTVFDRYEFLTPADTKCVMTRCHNAFAPGGQEGYLVVSAQNPFGFDVPWCHDYLVGSELVVNSSGAMYSLNAIPFRSLACNFELPLSTTDLDGDGQLDFDGLEYEGSPAQLIFEYMALPESRLSLINLTGTHADVNTVLFSVWNDNEFGLSTTLQFNCWFDVHLTRISQLFDHFFIKLNTPHDPSELDIDCRGKGRIETGWVLVDSVGVRTPGGFTVDSDGALLGSTSLFLENIVGTINGGRLVWESYDKQYNGTAFDL